MNPEIAGLVSPEIAQLVRLFALVASLLHLLFVFLLLRQAIGAAKMITTDSTGKLIALVAIHTMLLMGILLLVVFY